MDAHRKAEIDRLAELVNIGAGHAAGAFAQLVGRTVWTQVPVVHEGPEAPDSLPGADPESVLPTGVFFEFEGCLESIVGILFPAAASEMLARRMVGIEEGKVPDEVVGAVLTEVGNILASHIASAIADTLGSRLLPSIPSLVTEEAELRLARQIDATVGADALRFESTLCDEAGQNMGRLVLVPTQSDQL